MGHLINVEQTLIVSNYCATKWQTKWLQLVIEMDIKSNLHNPNVNISILTRMHSSRMRTTRLLPVSPTAQRGGSVCSRLGGVCYQEGVISQGWVDLGGVCFQGCLLPGDVCSQEGCLLPGWVSASAGSIPSCTEADPPE